MKLERWRSGRTRGIANAVTRASGSEGSNPSLSARRASCTTVCGALRSFAALALIGLLASCASRTVTYESEPPGATVWVALERVGETPVTVPFVHGGEREVLFTREGHEPLRIVHDSHSFALDTPGVDLVSGWFLSDQELVVKAELQPSDLARRIEDDEDSVMERLHSRAKTLKGRARELFLRAPPEPRAEPDMPELPPVR